MVDDQPAPIVIVIDEAEARWTKGFLSFNDFRECVSACVDRNVAIETNSLFTKQDLVGRGNGTQNVSN